MKKLIAAALILAVIIAIPVIIQSTARRAATNDPTVALAHGVMTSDLRGLAMTQAATRRVTGRYSTFPEETGHLSSPGVNVPVVAVVDTGWTAVVTHKNIPEVRCAIGVYARNPLRRSAKSGEIVCQ